MELFIEQVSECLPLEVSFVSWDETTLVISGVDWSFSTQSAWRFVENDVILFSCWDSGADINIVRIIGERVVDVEVLGLNASIDPIFLFSNKSRIEIFSTDAIEPWVLRIPGGKVFVGGS